VGRGCRVQPRGDGDEPEERRMRRRTACVMCNGHRLLAPVIGLVQRLSASSLRVEIEIV
jgi:hypothetical protein